MGRDEPWDGRVLNPVPRPSLEFNVGKGQCLGKQRTGPDMLIIMAECHRRASRGREWQIGHPSTPKARRGRAGPEHAKGEIGRATMFIVA